MDDANIKALLDGAARILGQLKLVDYAVQYDDEIFMSVDDSASFQEYMGDLQDGLLKVSALFPDRARPASRGALDPMAWLLDFFDSDLNQLLTQMKHFLTSIRGVTWAQVCLQDSHLSACKFRATTARI
jgi:hypothetical protein